MDLSEAARKQGALWGAAAHDWLQIQERTAPVLWRAVLDFAGVKPGARVLDAGCGAGGASVMAQEHGAIVTACDASEALLAIARERLPQADLRLAEIESLPYPDASFDVVLAINCLQFTGDPARAARELIRVAAPGARIAVVVWSVEHSQQAKIFEAFLSLFDKPPSGRGAFALSAPGEVEALFPGLSSAADEVDCPFVYPSLEIALRGQMSAGPSQRVVEIFGRAKVESTIRTALRPFITPSGEVKLNNRFRCVVFLR
jgi:SAM-dependent methyltransferase